MRNKFASVFYELAKEDERQCLIVADISPAGSIQQFREQYPERFINTGVSEQIMIGMAAGMNMAGLRPWAYTIATFALYRPFEFIRDDLAYQRLPVTVVGIGGGLAYSTLGATHHAMEDVAIAAAIPGLQIIAPCDPLEVEAATRWCAQQDQGPVYLRLGKAGEPNLTEGSSEPWSFGKVRKVRNGGSQVALVTYGPILGRVLDAAEYLKHVYDPPAVYACSTLRPLDHVGLRMILENYKIVMVVEEMVSGYGLGMWLQAMANQMRLPTQVKRYGLESQFKHVYGTHDDLLNAHDLTVERIVNGW